MKTKPNQIMKKTCFTLLVGLASLLAVEAQTDPTPANPPVEATNTAAAPDAGQPAAVADTNTPAATEATPAKDTNATATVTNEASSATDTNAPATAEATTATDTNSAVAEPVAIPQIKFSDVPITTAIENLARLANINYMLDPKIGYGQPDANGQIKPEPTLSIRWENITAENALLALLDNYSLQLIVDKKTGIDRITTKDPLAPPPLSTKVIQLKYASVSNLQEAAQSVLTDKRSKVLSDPRTSQLVVVATDPEQLAVDTLITQLDRPTRQVLIETRLVEISSNPKTQKGVDWSGTLQNQHVTFGNGNSQGTFTTSFPGTGGTDGAGVPTTSGWSTLGSVVNEVGSGGFSWNTKSGTTPDVGFLNADGLSAVLSFLNSSSDAQIMSTPRIVTLDNEEAKISVIRGYPIFNTSAGTANTAGGSSITYTNVGTVLHVTPRISANDYIWLNVTPEVSDYAGQFTQVIPNTGTSGGSSTVSAPLFDFRIVNTQVLIPNSNTLVMGGLVQDNPTDSSTKVPLLGDIPGLGFFFRSSSKAVNKQNLLIFITPTIVKDTDFQASNSGEFLKSKPAPLKDPLNPKTAWDGTQPNGSWSDPITETTK